MEDGEDSSCEASSLLESAARDASSNSNGSGRACLSAEAVQSLAAVFGDRGSSHESLWEELSARQVPLGALVDRFVGTMETPGRIGVEAAFVYLGLLLTPDCPLYSVFSSLAFQVLLRCLHNSFKPSGAPEESGSGRKKIQKKGKRARNVEEGNEEGASQDDRSGALEVGPVLSRLRAALRVISLRDHQGALKSLVEFLVELPHAVTGAAVIHTTFAMLEDLLQPKHGDVPETAILVLKLLTPSLLLTRAGGTSQQKLMIRSAAIEHVANSMLGEECGDSRAAVVALTRYLCFKAPEKTDARMQAVETVMHFVKHLTATEQQEFGKFVTKLSRSKPRYRLLALDLCGSLFSQLPDPLGVDAAEVERAAGDANGGSSSDGSRWGIACLEATLQRCSDKVPTIRARALATLAHVIEDLSVHVRQRSYLQELLAGLGSSTGNRLSDDGKSSWDTPFHAMGGENLFTVPGTRTQKTPAFLSPGAHKGDLGSLISKRCSDEKAAVRKGALLLLTKAAIVMGKTPDEQMLQAMGISCSDPMLSIRKAGLGALAEVTRKFSKMKPVVKEWLESALPLVMDNESSIQEEAVGLFKELVLDPISSVSVMKLSDDRLLAVLLDKSDETEKSLPPGVVHFLSGLAEKNDAAPFVKRACARLGKTKGLRASIVMALQSIITASEDLGRKEKSFDGRRVAAVAQGAWFLLSELSLFLPKVVGWDFLRKHWQYSTSAASAASRVHLLQTIANVATELPADAATDLADELLKHLEDFNMHPVEVGAHVNALTTLCRRKAASEDEGEELVTEWARQLLEKAEAIVRAYVSLDREKMNFQTPISIRRRPAGGRSTRKSRRVEPSSQIVTAVFTVGAIALVCPAANTGSITLLLQELVAESTDGNLLRDPAVSAQTWLTLGKLCLADDKLAKRLIPLFVQELDRTSSAATRNNIMVTLTDFCVRYTALIESYIPKLTKSLRDSCEVVRRQTFVLLARLLQRDYVKWRGLLFHRFLLALVDESPKICQIADFLFGNILKTKAPLLAYNSFVEAIFVLNDYQGQSSGSSALQSSESERDLFSLRGSTQAVVSKRMYMYTTLLKQMSPEHLLATSAKLCAEVLAGAADGVIDISTISGKCVVEDALKILALKEMRLGGNKASSNVAEQADEEENAATFAAVKGKVVTQLAKRNLVQNAIPIFIELKRLLEKSSSPLLGALMDCMRSMLKDFKNEIEEMLVADKQLLKELIYDMQKHEAAKARAKAAAAVQPEPQKQQFGGTAAGKPHEEAARPPVLSALKKTPAGRARVTWLDQTPQLRGLSSAGFISPGALRSRGGIAAVVSPQILVGAVGDIAAAATAASVLQDAATGKSTPLRAMSLPRLRTAGNRWQGGTAICMHASPMQLPVDQL
ncbi:condensin-2 complex subunit D3 [Selaginella moellendorffii]|uniref:condensin-2 complex subunit D3 n=1 Tax=Selaginella moellendorffii TaxID=88036 RepID=UPI000D1D11B2|nr:condensin-2 complex subunit D3 [Selaginella moellendorffii]|eukprot:XP_024534743.1 condensin-2 complex subunit D3 [Selaginella moellendorffii]